MVNVMGATPFLNGFRGQCGRAHASRTMEATSSRRAKRKATRMCHHGVVRRFVPEAAVVDPVEGRCTSVGMTRAKSATTALIAHARETRE